MKEVKEIYWVIKYHKKKIRKIYSHCKIIERTGAQGNCFRGKLRNCGDNYKSLKSITYDSIGLRDLVLKSKLRNIEDLLGEHVEQFL